MERSSRSDIQLMIHLEFQISKRFQCPADILVNSAGITRDGYLLKMTEQAFDQVIAVNLKGTFNTNQVLGKAMKTANISNGSIVNISSVIGNLCLILLHYFIFISTFVSPSRIDWQQRSDKLCSFQGWGHCIYQVCS